MRTLDTAVLKLMVASASANLKNNRKRVDDLNVFPVPDGDTGTNMSLTFSGAAAAVMRQPARISCSESLHRRHCATQEETPALFFHRLYADFQRVLKVRRR